MFIETPTSRKQLVQVDAFVWANVRLGALPVKLAVADVVASTETALDDAGCMATAARLQYALWLKVSEIETLEAPAQSPAKPTTL